MSIKAFVPPSLERNKGLEPLMHLCAYRLKVPHKSPAINPPQGEAVRKEPVFRTGERWRCGKQHERRKEVKAVARPLLHLYDIISPNCISLYFTVFYCTLWALSSSSSAAQAFLFVFQHHSREYPISSAMSSKLILLRCLKSRNSSHCGGS